MDHTDRKVKSLMVYPSRRAFLLSCICSSSTWEIFKTPLVTSHLGSAGKTCKSYKKNWNRWMETHRELRVWCFRWGVLHEKISAELSGSSSTFLLHMALCKQQQTFDTYSNRLELNMEFPLRSSLREFKPFSGRQLH